jgi:hypothetical protein
MTIRTDEILPETVVYLGRITRGQIKAWVQMQITIFEKEIPPDVEDLVN